MSCCGLLQLHSNLCCCCEKKMEENERKKEIFLEEIRRSKEKYTVSTKYIHFFVRMWCYFFSVFCSVSITCWWFRRVKSPTVWLINYGIDDGHIMQKAGFEKTKPKKNLLSNVTLECHRCPCLRFHRYPHRWHQSADGNLVFGDDVHEIEREMNWQKLKIVNIAGVSIETESTHTKLLDMRMRKRRRNRKERQSPPLL